MKNLAKKKGFTLIEVIVVMAILATISALAIGSYSEYRKNILIDLAAENMISQLEEMRLKAVHGHIGKEKFQEIEEEINAGGAVPGGAQLESSAHCYGLDFQKTGDVYDVLVKEYRFSGKKRWDSLASRWVYEGCKVFDPSVDVSSMIDLDADVVVFGLRFVDSEDAGGAVVVDSVQELIVQFLPPDGMLKLRDSLNEIDAPAAILEIDLRYLTDTNERYVRTIAYNLNTGNAKIVQ